MTRSERAIALFLDGCNCAQAVFVAFADLFGIEEKLALRMSSSFGGGLGRQREVCGAVSGMCMAAGALYGYDDVKDPAKKAAHYALIQALCGKFREKKIFAVMIRYIAPICIILILVSSILDVFGIISI